MTRVHVLATGGTIASRSGEGSGATAAHAAEALLAGMDATADVEITGEDVMTVGSYRLGLPELATIARTARERAADPGIDGVVVTHGTDTMEETAFLTDLLNGTDTPVVFTGPSAPPTTRTPTDPATSARPSSPLLTRTLADSAPSSPSTACCSRHAAPARGTRWSASRSPAARSWARRTGMSSACTLARIDPAPSTSRTPGWTASEST